MAKRKTRRKKRSKKMTSWGAAVARGPKKRAKKRKNQIPLPILERRLGRLSKIVSQRGGKVSARLRP